MWRSLKSFGTCGLWPQARCYFNAKSGAIQCIPNSFQFCLCIFTKMKVLVIEDEPDLQDVIKQSLQREGFVVEVAANKRQAHDKIVSFTYDCILLDIMLPDGNGLDILRTLKKLGKEDSIIIISAKNSVEDRIEGLNIGADDYLVKPFHIAELNARVKSVIRRKGFQGRQLVVLNNVTVDVDDRSVTINGELVAFNRKELDILLYFMMNQNRLVNKTSLAEHVWGDHVDEADSFEFIYSQIKNLRKKLKEHQAEVDIQAVYGIGYKLVAS